MFHHEARWISKMGTRQRSNPNRDQSKTKSPSGIPCKGLLLQRPCVPPADCPRQPDTVVLHRVGAKDLTMVHQAQKNKGNEIDEDWKTARICNFVAWSQIGTPFPGKPRLAQATRMLCDGFAFMRPFSFHQAPRHP